jgi:ligand-binding sensor domain-containing protein
MRGRAMKKCPAVEHRVWRRWVPAAAIRMVSSLVILMLAGSVTLAQAELPGGDLFRTWEIFTKKEGLPSDKVMAVVVDGPRVWAGTEKGLALVQGNTVHRVDAEGDLPFPAITSLAVSPETGDLWIGTLGGLGHLSGGLFESFDQLNSGLANDVVYGVAVDGDGVWVATAAGLSHLDLSTGAWAIYDTTNTLMHEPWCYAVTLSENHIYTAVWGSGVLVRERATGRFRVHRDPDHEMEIDLFRDDGLVHDVTSAIAFSRGTLWVGTYFGLSRYQERRWRSWYADESGLAGDFINFLRADGDRIWVATDAGVSRFDGSVWHTWRRGPDGGHDLEITHEDGPRTTLHPSSGPPNNTIFSIDLDGEDVWLATADGLAHGIGIQTSSPAGNPPGPGTEREQP